MMSQFKDRGQAARRLLLALLAILLVLGGLLPIGPAPAPASLGAATAPAAEHAAAGVASAPKAADAGADEQPQSWLLKWIDPAKAHALGGVKVLHRQPEAAVEVVCPSDDETDVKAWLARLQKEPGIAYVHPNGKVHTLAQAAGDNAAQPATELAAPDLNKAMSSQSTSDPNKAASGKSAIGSDGSSQQNKQQQGLGTDRNGRSETTLQQNSRTITLPNDPHLSKQNYLAQIGAHKAWEIVREQNSLVIAIVDTGVDLQHPDLKDNLVEGFNILSPKKPPMDDNGHGTAVAGVLGAAGNNGTGVAGILWKAKLMPIKALDYRGDGSEQDLGEGILYAVRSGAKIVVLSVGLYRYSPYMEDIVNYAESKGVLLVAASGNDGKVLGSKVAVKYPAAYPTVLATGGAKPDGNADLRTNTGPELDISAPWNVFTTALGGGYRKDEGTSLAAPQVAGAAALVWAQNPKLKPYQVRELLRQTAKKISGKVHTNQSGYGLLQIDKAVTMTLKEDAYEPNDNSKKAAELPLQSYIIGELTAPNDQDWFYIDAPYDGEVTLFLDRLAATEQAPVPVRLTQFTGGKAIHAEIIKQNNKSVTFQTTKGKHHFQLMFVNSTNLISVPYRLTNQFAIKADPFEPNDKSFDAYPLEAKSQTISGNFHQKSDRDWFSVEFKEKGKLKLTLSTDTVRIDPSIAVQKAGGQMVIYDDAGEGATEQTPIIDVVPGKYLIRLHNAVSTEASPVVGTYELKMEYTKQYTDPNEPNDKHYQSVLMKSGATYNGVISSLTDIDWFQFRLDEPVSVSLLLTDVPKSANMTVELYDKKLTKLQTTRTGSKGKLSIQEQVMKPGVYYVKLFSDKSFDTSFYKLKLQVERLEAGFSDIKNHWAKKEIIALSNRGIVNGVGNYRFAPDRAITRAEAVAMIVKAYKPAAKPASLRRFKDMSSNHWAAEFVQKAVQQGWVNGYPNGSFKPDEPITRAQMAVLIGKAEGIRPLAGQTASFQDVPAASWYAPMLAAMRAKGKLSGMPGNRFKPEKQASRAEFTVLLYRFLVQK